MKKIIFILFSAVLLSTVLMAQKGIRFDESPTWQAVKDRAKAENKYIFMDAYTTWCGPCKAMAKNIFPLPEVGAFFNDKFINLKVQLDTTKNDNEFIKSWYADAHHIMIDYQVRVFPTYLFFSPDGQLVHRAVGSSEAPEFIAKAKDALNPDKQYYTLVRRYEAGDKSPVLIRQVALSANAAYDMPAAAKYSKEYLATQTNLLSAENMEFLATFTRASTDPGFSLMLKNLDVFEQVLGAGKAKDQIRGILLREEILPAFKKESPDFAELQANVEAKYPGYGEELTLRGQMMFYQRKNNWPAFAASVNQYLSKYEKYLSAAELNSFAWRVFESCPDMACVNEALNWSKRTVDQTNDPMYMDTYANLLYKTGNKKDAIEWQKKAIAVTIDKKEDADELKKTLEKMLGDEKTWN